MKTSTLTQSIFIHFLLLCIITRTEAQSDNQEHDLLLDRQSFTIKMYDVNIPDQLSDDILIFNDGKLDSQACQPYGFHPSIYQTSKHGEQVKFWATCSSDKEGTMAWNGVVTSKGITGEIAWQKKGQNTINYKFAGTKRI